MLKGCSKVKTEVRREQITQAAFNVISSHGVKGLTTSAIAKDLGISGANLYRHFENKKEILNSVVDKIGEGLLQNLEAVQRSPFKNPLLKLRRLFKLHLEYIENNKGIPRLVYSEEMHIANVKLRGRLLDAINSYTKGIALLIRGGQENGTINKNMDPKSIDLMPVCFVKYALEYGLR